MKTTLRIGLCALIAGCLLSFAGCKKKEEPAKQAVSTATNAAKSAAQKPAAETTKVTAETVKPAAIETIPVADIQAEAAKMTVEQLKAKAMEYKNLIVTKKAAIEQLTAKLKAIPIAEQMGAEAKGLQTDIATLNKSVAALTERFKVYYNKLNEMGADLSALKF
jgi:hypothetical protein